MRNALIVILLTLACLHLANEARELNQLYEEKYLELQRKQQAYEEHYIHLQENLQRMEQIFSELGLDQLYALEVTATAYAPSENKSGICADENPSITSTGTPAVPGVLAVNPDIIPYNSRVYVPSRGWLRAEDTGGALLKRNDQVDILMDTHKEAINWGNPRTQILVLP